MVWYNDMGTMQIEAADKNGGLAFVGKEARCSCEEEGNTSEKAPNLLPNNINTANNWNTKRLGRYL